MQSSVKYEFRIGARGASGQLFSGFGSRFCRSFFGSGGFGDWFFDRGGLGDGGLLRTGFGSRGVLAGAFGGFGRSWNAFSTRSFGDSVRQLALAAGGGVFMQGVLLDRAVDLGVGGT